MERRQPEQVELAMVTDYFDTTIVPVVQSGHIGFFSYGVAK